MSSTLTVRIPAQQRKALRRHAALLKTTESEVVRTALHRMLEETPILDRVRHLVGSLDSSTRTIPLSPWAKSIYERNSRK